jgi:hypothetical protein
VSPVLGAVLFAAAVWVLHRELRQVRYREVAEAVRALPPARLLLAFLFTFANYAILTGFDLLAFVYVGKRIAGWKVALASYTGYAVSNSVGFALISGTSVRYRFYTRWGLTAAELSQVVVFYFGTFWLGAAGAGWAEPGPSIRTPCCCGRWAAACACWAWRCCSWRPRTPRRRCRGGARCACGASSSPCRRRGWWAGSSCFPRWTGRWPPGCSTPSSRPRRSPSRRC